MPNMRLRLKRGKIHALGVLVILFMVYVSFKILEPEFAKHRQGRDAGDTQDYVEDNDIIVGLPVVINGESKNVDSILTSPSTKSFRAIVNNVVKKGNNLKHPYPLKFDRQPGILDLDELENLMPVDFTTEIGESRDNLVQRFLRAYDLDWKIKLKVSPWKVAERWATPRQVHPENAPELGALLREMSSREIVQADTGYRGTQLKLSLTLNGGQKVVFKPKWFNRDHIISGPPYAGGDRHNGEIASFHLIRLLGFRRAPLVVGRIIDLEKEIIPIATDKLLRTFFKRGNSTCFFGKCRYCKSEADGVCAEGSKLEGAVVLWLPKHLGKFKLWRHPWGRTYKANNQARWEKSDTYCDIVKQTSPYDRGPRFYDIVDACISDYLIGNADRHHYETWENHTNSMLVMLDNGKSFGNPSMDEITILAPVYQCCRIRESTWHHLRLLSGGVLSRVMKTILDKDPISPILTQPHIDALDRRLYHILVMLQACMDTFGYEHVCIKL